MSLHSRPSRVSFEGFEFGYTADEFFEKVFKKCRFKYVSIKYAQRACIWDRKV